MSAEPVAPEHCDIQSLPRLSPGFCAEIAVLGVPWLVEVLPQSLPSDLCGILPLYLNIPFYITPTGLGTQPSPVSEHLKEFHFQMFYFQIRSHSDVPRVKTSPWEFSETQFKPIRAFEVPLYFRPWVLRLCNVSMYPCAEERNGKKVCLTCYWPPTPAAHQHHFSLVSILG